MFRTGCLETHESCVARHLPHQERDSDMCTTGVSSSWGRPVMSWDQTTVCELLVLQILGFDLLLKPYAGCEDICLLWWLAASGQTCLFSTHGILKLASGCM